MPDAHKNLAYSLVATAPSPATSGTSLVVTAGQGALFPTPPFNATVWAAGVMPITTNAEIIRVTAISTDTLTIVRAQESTAARTVIVGDQIAATITSKTFTDIESSGMPAPDDFSFTAQTDTLLNTVITSNTVTLNGESDAVWPVTVRGTGVSAQLSINGGTWATDGIARKDDTIQVRLTSSGSALTLRTATLYMPHRTETFNVTTKDVFVLSTYLGSSLDLWLDASVLGLANDAEVASFTDSSSNARHFVQSSASLRPLFKTNILNSLSSVLYDGSDDTLLNASMPSVNIGTTGLTLFMVLKPVATGGSYPGLFTTQSSGQGLYLLDGTDLRLDWYGNADRLSTSSLVNGTAAMISSTLKTSSIEFWFNGTLSNTVAITHPTLTYYYIGRAAFKGYIMEMIVCHTGLTTGLSTTQRQKVEGYLAWKWGLQASLPGDHPWVAGAP